MILRGDLPPGSKVHLDQLRERFGVSLSPMREAVSRLVADGIVVFEDQRGYRIAPVSRENLMEISQVRADVESLTLRYAIAAADLDWESEILAALHRVNRTPRDNDLCNNATEGAGGSALDIPVFERKARVRFTTGVSRQAPAVGLNRPTT